MCPQNITSTMFQWVKMKRYLSHFWTRLLDFELKWHAWHAHHCRSWSSSRGGEVNNLSYCKIHPQGIKTLKKNIPNLAYFEGFWGVIRASRIHKALLISAMWGFWQGIFMDFYHGRLRNLSATTSFRPRRAGGLAGRIWPPRNWYLFWDYDRFSNWCVIHVLNHVESKLGFVIIVNI